MCLFPFRGTLVRLKAADLPIREGDFKCSWFERMLLEAIIFMEFYSALKDIKQGNPYKYSGNLSLFRFAVGSFSFSRSRGKEPIHSILYDTLYNLPSAMKVSLWVFLFWRAWTAFYSNNPDLLDTIWISLLSIYGLNLIGKWLIQKIHRWTHPYFVNEPYKQRFLALTSVCMRLNLASYISTTLLRESISSAANQDVFFDPIVVALLDRAIASEDFIY